MKKFSVVLIVIVLIAGWVVSATGAGIGGSLDQKIKLGLDMIGGVSVVLEADTDATGAELASIMEQVQAVMENRVNELGLSEPVIAVENGNRIRIELPGAQDAQDAIAVIGRTAQLGFYTADWNLVMDGSHVKGAQYGTYQGTQSGLIGTYTVDLEFDQYGADAFAEATKKIMNGEITSTTNYYANQIAIFLDDEEISAPMVSTIINSTKCQITGQFTQKEAANLAALIRGGALPVALNEVQTEIVGPTLGINAARTSLIAGFIGVILIFIIMIAAYRIMGVVADISLALYILIVAWIMVAFKAVLTLPGIAGIILSVGMAVDSNVIIFARIREEMGLGKSVRVAVHSGFKRAMGTIIDSQVTTVIAAVILFEFGTGSVRGFATTLLIGILVSIFTAVIISQVLLKFISETRAYSKPEKYGVKTIADEETKPMFEFVKNRRFFYMGAAALIVLGLGIGLLRGFNLGIDFTGGTLLQLNMGTKVESSEVNSILKDNGVDKADIRFAGENNEKLIIKTTQVLSNDQRGSIYKALEDRYSRNEADMVETAGLIGPTVGSQLKTNALKAIAFACVAMLIYVAVRFEWRFGIAAIMALLHDAAMLFALYGLCHIQMNSPFIAGLLIVIGYSINDTIVIFDRIRENLGYAKKSKLEPLIDRSITQCVVRSIMTSLTTIVAIIPLIIMGGSSIREFTLPLIAGVLFGTFSSLCVASSFYYDINRLTKKNRYKGA